MRFVIDECLSPKLVEVAHGAGYEAYHVAHRGWSGETDSSILVDNVRRREQMELFARALEVARAMTSLINKVVEISADGVIAVNDLSSM